MTTSDKLLDINITKSYNIGVIKVKCLIEGGEYMSDKEKEQLLEMLRLAIENATTDKIVITIKPNKNCSKPKDSK
jgi:hypothetical protein